MLDHFFNILMVIGIVFLIIIALVFMGGLNILSFISGILTSPVCWVVIGIVVVVAYWWHENS